MGCHNLRMNKTWKEKVLALQSRGWTLAELAVKSGASIGAIADLKKERTREPRANVGLKLHRLYSTGAKPVRTKAVV